MRAALLLGCLIVIPLSAAPSARYGVEPDTTKYPQDTPKTALASVLKAIEAKEFRYLVAHLADPTFIDERIKGVYAGNFDEQVGDTRTRLDALIVKQLQRFAKDGTWKIGETEAQVTAESIDGRCVRLIKKEGRWFLSHRFDLSEKKPDDRPAK